MEEEFKKILVKAVDIAEKTGDFVIQQAPDVLQQFIAWRYFSHISGIVVGILLIIAGRYLIVNLVKERGEGVNAYFDGYFFGKNIGEAAAIISWVVFAISSAFGVCCIVINIMDLAQLYLAPKIYLIEYIANLTG